MSERKIGSPGFLLALAFIVLIFFWLFAPCCCHHGNARERARRVGCANNLKQIGIMCQRYQHGHGGKCPGGINELSRSESLNPRLFVCPSSGSETGVLEKVERWADYVYVPGLTTTSSPNAILAYCHPKNHDGDGGNVLFADGHVEWVSIEKPDDDSPNFREILNAVREQGKK